MALVILVDGHPDGHPDARLEARSARNEGLNGMTQSHVDINSLVGRVVWVVCRAVGRLLGNWLWIVSLVLKGEMMRAVEGRHQPRQAQVAVDGEQRFPQILGRLQILQSARQESVRVESLLLCMWVSLAILLCSVRLLVLVAIASPWRRAEVVTTIVMFVVIRE